jgi:hypothetical protein
MTISAWKAWALGCALVFIYTMMVVVPDINKPLWDFFYKSPAIGWIMPYLKRYPEYVVPAAAFVTGYLAPRRKILLGASLAFPFVIFNGVGILINCTLAPPRICPNIAEAAMLSVFALIAYAVYCAAGAALGALADYLAGLIDSLVDQLVSNKKQESGADPG